MYLTLLCEYSQKFSDHYQELMISTYILNHFKAWHILYLTWKHFQLFVHSFDDKLTFCLLIVKIIWLNFYYVHYILFCIYVFHSDMFSTENWFLFLVNLAIFIFIFFFTLNGTSLWKKKSQQFHHYVSICCISLILIPTFSHRSLVLVSKLQQYKTLQLKIWGEMWMIKCISWTFF